MYVSKERSKLLQNLFGCLFAIQYYHINKENGLFINILWNLTAIIEENTIPYTAAKNDFVILPCFWFSTLNPIHSVCICLSKCIASQINDGKHCFIKQLLFHNLGLEHALL